MSSPIHHYRSLRNYDDFYFCEKQKCEDGPYSIRGFYIDTLRSECNAVQAAL